MIAEVGARASAAFAGLLMLVLLIVVGERLGWFHLLESRIPWPLWASGTLLAGFPAFRDVAWAARRGRVTPHTLMTAGVLATALVGEWSSALVLALFMRIGEEVERLTVEQARRAMRSLLALRPQRARVLRAGEEREVPVEAVQPGEVVVVRPGERIPVDGEVIEGHATVDPSALTGEAMPVEVGPGDRVWAASICQLGSLRVRATSVGADTTFGRILRLVEEAERSRPEVQRLADRVATWYLPVVATVGLLTLVLRRDPLAMAAVFAVACTCAFALATPVAMLAAIGAAARRGLLIKGGRFLEVLARVEVLLIDKTGTVTLGRPQVTDVIPLDGWREEEVLAFAAAAERDSEHPLAEAVRALARERGVQVPAVETFEALPGIGVRAQIGGHTVTVGRIKPDGEDRLQALAARLAAEGKTVVAVRLDGRPIGLLTVQDTLRPEVRDVLQELQRLGIRRIELLTGDRPEAAAAVARSLGIPFRAGLLPEDKIAVVRAYQAQGRVVGMVGDGVNDAPALAQADVGIAMGSGTDVALEAGHIVLLRDDWRLLPEAVRIARSTMDVIRWNFALATVYNGLGALLAALGILPPILAAAAQVVPDVGILLNSARLLRR
ncbi:MAG: cation-translocating P-type ATPase [Thermoflexus hugenholtzii]|uniref:heavy metal translocating P-type ATPase n=1 Tax=Thermoflexus TaxID=1495649 RepID=UPI001C758093|nr:MULTISPECIES: cation-translocating P-type ATPase [Thermoflexus]QWK11197.1 MAG: cation-translocating P-type ATPase [Thermoflexus hugenholtzii]